MSTSAANSDDHIAALITCQEVSAFQLVKCQARSRYPAQENVVEVSFHWLPFPSNIDHVSVWRPKAVGRYVFSDTVYDFPEPHHCTQSVRLLHIAIICRVKISKCPQARPASLPR